jgi:DNA-binding transcriptional LysR family regulator
MTRRTPRHAYKQVRFEQLRSFCETARLGSFTAAAAALGLAHPTVWEQVHALERSLNAVLIEPHGRGCRLTAEGRLLAELAAPMVTGLGRLFRDFEEQRGQVHTRLVVATMPRVLVEDLPRSIVEFKNRFPQVELSFLELLNERVPLAVEAGEADLGLTAERQTDPPSPWLVFEPAYELDLFLVTPKDHPLARRRTIRPQDLLKYPLVNSPRIKSTRVVMATLEKLGLHTAWEHSVEVSYTACIRRCVEIGLGIGVVSGLPSHRPQPNLHERSISRQFGRVTMNFVYRKGTSAGRGFNDLMSTIKRLLNHQPQTERGHR